MPKGFDARSPPFDRLTHQEAEQLRAALDIGYFRPEQVIVEKGKPSDVLHVVIKGAVEGRDGDALQGVLGPKDSFDARAVVHGAAGEDFVATQETLCYLVPRSVVLDLIGRNAGFAAFFYAEISRKLDAFARRAGADGVEQVLRMRVHEARPAPAVWIDGDATIEQAALKMQDANRNALFVQAGEKVGIVTGMTMAKAVVLRHLPASTPVRDVCQYDVVSIAPDDFVYEALIEMTRGAKRRIAVRDGTGFSGVLEDIDILGLFAGNSQLIPGRIDRARVLDDLKNVASDIAAQVERLHAQGIRVELIADLTSDLNRRLLGKVFDLIAPDPVREHGCVMAMGSEGRGEQSVRTDQDNGLLLAQPVPEAELARFREEFSAALDSFGFPPCPGNIMVRNPVWSRTLGDFTRQLQSWIDARDPDAAMNLGIFFDAVGVGGRTELVDAAKAELIARMRGEGALLARFAHLVETFAAPSMGMINAIMVSVGVGAEQIDIKRAGTFPIVHGVRTMAIERGLTETGTAARIARLAALNAFNPGFAEDLTGALRVFMEFRLRSQLAAARRGTTEGESVVRLAQLGPADRDILRDALRIARQFRDVLRAKYQLSNF